MQIYNKKAKFTSPKRRAIWQIRQKIVNLSYGLQIAAMNPEHYH